MNQSLALSELRIAYMELQAEYNAYVTQTECKLALLQKQVDDLSICRSMMDECRKELKKAELKIEKLERDLANAKRDSSNSSKPPSSDFFNGCKKPKNDTKKASETDQTDGKNSTKKKRGGQPGHPDAFRENVPLEDIPPEFRHVYELTSCPKCGGPLTQAPGKEKVIQQIEIAPQPPIIHDHRANAYWCEHCQAYHYAKMPKPVVIAWGAGPQLVAHIAHMKHVLFQYPRIPSQRVRFHLFPQLYQ